MKTLIKLSHGGMLCGNTVKLKASLILNVTLRICLLTFITEAPANVG